MVEPTADHATLLAAAYWRWNDCEYGAPEIDPKRPYGNSDVEGDLAELLPHLFAEDRRRVHRELVGVIPAMLRAEVERLSAEPDEAAITAAEDVLCSAEVQMPYRVRAAEFVSMDSEGAERDAEFASMHAAEDEASAKNREIVRQAVRAAIRALRPEGGDTRG